MKNKNLKLKYLVFQWKYCKTRGRNRKCCHFPFRKGLSGVLDPIHSNLLMKWKVRVRAIISAVTAWVKNMQLGKLFLVISQVIQIIQSRSIHKKKHCKVAVFMCKSFNIPLFSSLLLENQTMLFSIFFAIFHRNWSRANHPTLTQTFLGGE